MTREDAIFAMEHYKLHFALTRKAIEAFDMAIKALEQEPCVDAISREDALMALTGEWKESLIEILPKAIKRINELPPVTAEKVGQWILLDKCSNSGYYCSECRKRVVKEGWSDTIKIIKYCPNCGSRMIQEGKNDRAEIYHN